MCVVIVVVLGSAVTHVISPQGHLLRDVITLLLITKCYFFLLFHRPSFRAR